MKNELINHISGFSVAGCLIAAGVPHLAVAQALTTGATIGGLLLFARPKPYQKQIKAVSKKLSRQMAPVETFGPRGEAMQHMAAAIAALKPEDCPSRDLLARHWGDWTKLADVALDSMAARDPVFKGPYAEEAHQMFESAFAALREDREFAETIIPDILAYQTKLLTDIKADTKEILGLLKNSSGPDGDTEDSPTLQSPEQFAEAYNELLNDPRGSFAPARAKAAQALADLRAGDREDAQDEFDEATSLFESGLKERAEMRAQIAKEDAADWRRLGRLTLDTKPSRALDAFRQATALDPSDFWSLIYLSRLERTHAGNLPAALEAAEAAERATTDNREAAIAISAQADTMEKIGDLIRVADLREREADTMRKQAEAFPDDEAAKRDLYVSLFRLGNLARARGQLEDAERHYTESLDLARALADTNPTSAQAKRDLSVSLNKLGDLASARGQLETAEAFYTEDLNIARTLADANPTSAEAKRDLAVSYEKMGDVSLANGNQGKALEWYQKEVKISEERMALDPTNADAKRFHVVVLAKLGDASGYKAHYQEALSLALQMEAAGQLAPTDAFIPDYLRGKLAN